MTDAANNENELSKNEMFLTAFLDNELSPQERAQAEQMVRDNPEFAHLVEAWRENGNAIRALPRFQLDDQFATRVLKSLPVDSATVTSPAPASLSTSDSVDRRIGLAAIMTLAAMLSLTLFVFPLLSDNSTDELAENSPSMGVIEADPNSTEAVATPRQPRIPTPKMSTGEVNHGRPVDPIELTKFMNRPAGAEQVIWIDQRSLASIESVLQSNSIKIVAEGETNPNQDLVAHSDDGVEAIYVVATSKQMKKAIGELKSQSSEAIRAFPLPVSSSVWEKANTQPAAQQIKPIDLANADADEIATLDKWFGLVDEDDSRLIKFLFLINTPAK